jgi:hypothetical protein
LIDWAIGNQTLAAGQSQGIMPMIEPSEVTLTSC